MNLSKISLINVDPEKLVEDGGAKTVAFCCRNCPVLVDARLIGELKQVSLERGGSNVRICLHDGPDARQHDMVALERKGRYYRPHKHARKGDTFHMLKGQLGIFSFDTGGNVTDAVVIGPGEIYRTGTNMYHAILPLTDFVIHHESKPGPFEGENDSIYPDWPPDGRDSSETAAYVNGLAARMRERKARVFVVMGDGEINGGSVWEAAMRASKHRLSKLTGIIDNNKLQATGPTAEILELEALADKWRAFGFAVAECDGHDVEALRATFERAPFVEDKPSVVICNTVKGKVIDFAEHDPTWHHKSGIGADLVSDLRASVDRAADA